MAARSGCGEVRGGFLQWFGAVWVRVWDGEGDIPFLSCIESLRLILSLMLDMFAVCERFEMFLRWRCMWKVVVELGVEAGLIKGRSEVVYLCECC